MKYIVLDLMMGLICVMLILTIIGMFLVPDVLSKWSEMRSEV